MMGLAVKQNTPVSTNVKAATDFRQKVRAQYHQAMAHIDSALDLIISRIRVQIDRKGDPVSPTDVQNLLETALAVYTAKCGPLDRSNAASLILKTIHHCLDKRPSGQPSESRET
jgi:hypothetical protein